MKNINAISIHAQTINPKKKSQLLDTYIDYSSIARSFEQVIQMHSTIYLANYQLNMVKNQNSEILPWEIDTPNKNMIEAYKGFVGVSEENDTTNNYAYISLSKTTPDKENDLPSIRSTPSSYGVHTQTNSLPHCIERFIIAYKKDALLKDVKFIIDGKHLITYNGTDGDVLLSTAFEDEIFRKSISCMLNIITEMPKKRLTMQDKEFEKANIEGLLRELMSPFENVLLSSLSSLTEESYDIIKTILQKKYPHDILNKAESQGFIPSSHEFQDLLNIRHLLHHQFDTLDGYGRFINGKDNQNKSIRERYMESYRQYCSGGFVERINTYVEATEIFKPLIEGLIPNMFIRQKQESNSKFLQRIKEYAKSNPNTQIFVETSYSYKDKKKEALIKNINKIIPNAQIIDQIQDGNINDFSIKIGGYMQRHKYLEIFQILEHRISEYFLLQGDKCPPHIGWTKLLKDRVISPKDAEKWEKYKTLRNDLSHTYLSKELLEQMERLLPSLISDAIALSDRFDEIRPNISINENNICTATHSNGKVVKIDFTSKTVLSVTDKKGNELKTKTASTPKGKYVEEHKNGTKIYLKGTNITKVTLCNGITVDNIKHQLSFSDTSKLYFKDDRYYLVLPNAKMILTPDFEVISYIEESKKINISTNEIIRPNSRYCLRVNAQRKLSSIEFTAENKKTITLEFNDNYISFSDNTRWNMKENTTSISHNNITLSYQNRKQFVDSYDLPPIIDKRFDR